MLNQTILNHDSSHKTDVPAYFECRHGFQTSLSACIMGDSEAQKAIIELTVSANAVSFVYNDVPICV